MSNRTGEKRERAYRTRNGALISALELAQLLGTRGNSILKNAGIAPSLAQGIGARVPSARLIDAIEVAAIATARSDFGLLLGSFAHHSFARPAGLLMEQTSTVAEAMELCRHGLSLHNNGWTIHWSRRGRTPVLCLDLRARGKHEPRHFVEGLVLEILRVARDFLGPDWQPMAVAFRHEQLSPRAIWERYLGPNVMFGQSMIGIKFSQDELRRRMPASKHEVRRELEAMLHRVDAQHNDTPAKVMKLLRALLPVRRGSIEEVAEMMGMMPRTLQRRLVEHDVKFLDLVATTRLAMATECIGQKKLSLAQTAPLLGFSQQSALSRFLRTSAGLGAHDLRSAEAEEPHKRTHARRPGGRKSRFQYAIT